MNTCMAVELGRFCGSVHQDTKTNATIEALSEVIRTEIQVSRLPPEIRQIVFAEIIKVRIKFQA